MKNIKKFNESSDLVSGETNRHLLVVSFSSGDEIHFNVLDLIHLDSINDSIDADDTGSINDIVVNNSLDHFMFQTYVTTDISRLSKFNVVKCVHLPEIEN